MMAKDNTGIDYVNKLIYTSTVSNLTLSKIIGLQETTSHYSVPSFVYKDTKYFGTGSNSYIYENGSLSESYTLTVEGDINGDSAVDVLDASGVEQATNGHNEITDAYFLAAD